ncbi:MAG: hypothetical protein MUF62_00900 [Chitinophagaceae bacterium]|jgi:hypothetical protein|nr:hypothetical protein [Chitinophagaceae bacterium]
MKFYTLLLAGTASLCSWAAAAQPQTRVGATFTADLTYSGNLQPGMGLVLERKMTRRSGLETGIYYRNNPVAFTTFIQIPSAGSFSFNSSLNERFISIPVLYKFYSRIVNFSVGPTFDFMLGWKQTSGRPQVNIDSYSTSNKFDLGAMLKLSKQIKLADQWLLEPELRLNPLFSGARIYGGLSIGTRYVLK